MDCRALLEAGAYACVECGTKVGLRSGQSAEGVPISATPIAPNRNTLTYHEDRNTRHFDASLTDQAMQGLGEVLGELFVQRGVARTIQTNRQLPESPVIDSDRTPPTLPALEAVNVTDVPPSTPQVKVQSSSDRDGILKLFASKGDALELVDNRLKATSQAEYLRRLTYLFLYAHECFGRPSVLESDLRVVLRKNKLMDTSGNTNRWLKKRVGIASEDDDRVKLTAPGREEAVKALTQALDGNIVDSWTPDKLTTKAKNKGTSKKA